MLLSTALRAAKRNALICRRPRPHHYGFAHRALPGVALNPDVDLRALATAGRLDEALRATWAAVGERQSEADRLAGEGLRGEIVDMIGTPAVLLTFPRHFTRVKRSSP